MNRLIINTSFDCAGCGACVSICPKNCFELTKDELGFNIVRYVERGCMDCGLCKKVCPQNRTNIPQIKNTKIIIGQASDHNLLELSSSGGFWGVLSKYVISLGGVVWGVEMDEKGLTHFTEIRDENELYRIQGSKYSEVNEPLNYKLIKKQLLNENLILVGGTPCQIFALRRFLGNRCYDNLILVDLLCYGIQSPYMWQKYLKDINKKNRPIKYIQMRSKRMSWINYSMNIVYKDNHRYTRLRYWDPWLLSYSTSIMNRESCSDCMAKKSEHLSDFTIGDYWAAEYLSSKPSFFNIDKGISVVYIHSKKGEEILHQISDFFCYITLEDKGHPFTNSFSMHKNRALFIHNVESTGFSKTVYAMLKKGFSLWMEKRVPIYAYRTRILLKKFLNIISLKR